MLNLGIWLLFAGLLWRLLPVSDGRSWVAWAGLLFSAGALHVARLGLTDLLAVTLLALAMQQAERQRPWAALLVVALAGLARETALLGVVALWRQRGACTRSGIAAARVDGIRAVESGPGRPGSQQFHLAVGGLD
jgi:hypothetical protein